MKKFIPLITLIFLFYTQAYSLGEEAGPPDYISMATDILNDSNSQLRYQRAIAIIRDGAAPTQAELQVLENLNLSLYRKHRASVFALDKYSELATGQMFFTAYFSYKPIDLIEDRSHYNEIKFENHSPNTSEPLTLYDQKISPNLVNSFAEALKKKLQRSRKMGRKTT